MEKEFFVGFSALRFSLQVFFSGNDLILDGIHNIEFCVYLSEPFQEINFKFSVFQTALDRASDSECLSLSMHT